MEPLYELPNNVWIKLSEVCEVTVGAGGSDLGSVMVGCTTPGYIAHYTVKFLNEDAAQAFAKKIVADQKAMVRQADKALLDSGITYNLIRTRSGADTRPRLAKNLWLRNMRHIALAAAASIFLVGCMEKTRALAPNWYQWADLSNSPEAYAPKEMRRAYDMTARCLCSPGFKVVDVSETVFRVVEAPDGYRDTVGKLFLSKPHECLNCAD